jgi:hypothetical protein
MSPKLKHFFDWYESERPSWNTVLDKVIELTWLENRAWTAAEKHIVGVVMSETYGSGTERPVQLTMQEVVEQHTTWFRNLVTAQLDIWQNTPRA